MSLLNVNDKVSLLDRFRIDPGEEDRSLDRDRLSLAVHRNAIMFAGVGAVALVLLAIALWALRERNLGVLYRAAAPVTVSVAAGSPQVGIAPASPAGPAADAAPMGPASILDASGYIIPQRQATVSAKKLARVSEVLIEAGQSVRAGDVVARLDDSNTLASLEAAKAALTQATAALDAARRALADARPMFERLEQQHAAGGITAQDFDAAKGSFDAALSSNESEEAAVEVARANLLVAQRLEEDTTVRAPLSGVVTDTGAQPGEMVSPKAASGLTRTGICTIVDMSSLEADVDVSESLVSRVHAGQPAIIRLNAYQDWAISGNVVAIIPRADPTKATVKVRVGFKTRDPRILPYMGARISFLADAGVRGTAAVAR